ncbi:helix-turn-helix transcriptional regulator [Bacillus sp. B4EP4a]|uniref:PadR family transcriptional regulator n=1 Tax=Bacillus sp. B4EP4a TaxID=2590665 RepID=UPI0011529770|nr:helix-turn-helix transcriptional regulator [Bacillus sp. B4EP4a]
MVLLSFLAQKDMYGYEMIVIYIIKEGMLYPALKRLEEKEYLNSYRQDFLEGLKRKYLCDEIGYCSVSRLMGRMEQLSRYTL